MATGAEHHEQKMAERRLEKEKELMREEHIVAFIEKVLHEHPKGDFDHFIRDAVILSKLMTAIVFNSVPNEQISEEWGSDACKDRTKTLLREMLRYGVKGTFNPEDLNEGKDLVKVTKAVEELADLAEHDSSSLVSKALHE